MTMLTKIMIVQVVLGTFFVILCAAVPIQRNQIQPDLYGENSEGLDNSIESSNSALRNRIRHKLQEQMRQNVIIPHYITGNELVRRELDELGGVNLIKRELDELGGANLIKRELDELGGANLIKRELDELGGANLIKRELDELGGPNLIKRGLNPNFVRYLYRTKAQKRELDELGGANLI